MFVEIRPDLAPYLQNVNTTRADHQHRSPRRESQSGVIGFHVTGVPSSIWTEQMAQSIANNPKPASYHIMVDDDGDFIVLLPDDVEAFQVGVSPFNRHAFGLSAIQTESEWDPNSAPSHNALRAAAKCAVAYWRRNGFDPIEGARFLDYDSALYGAGGPGYVNHGTLQPGDRSDAWTSRALTTQLELQALLIQFTIEEATGGSMSAEDVRLINEHTSAMINDQTGKLWRQSVWHREKEGSLWLVYRQDRIWIPTAEHLREAIEKNGAYVAPNPTHTELEFDLKEPKGRTPDGAGYRTTLQELNENVGALMAMLGWTPDGKPPSVALDQQ